jgi:hypothetical protein
VVLEDMLEANAVIDRILMQEMFHRALLRSQIVQLPLVMRNPPAGAHSPAQGEALHPSASHARRIPTCSAEDGTESSASELTTGSSDASTDLVGMQKEQPTAAWEETDVVTLMGWEDDRSFDVESSSVADSGFESYGLCLEGFC